MKKKYIRTADGIYSVVWNNYHDGYDTIGGKNFQQVINKNEVLKEADTPEELCDEFVIKHQSSPKPYVADGDQKTQILKDKQKVFEYGVEEVKGAIYAEEGLIYVIKMNEKGDWELI